MGKLRILLFFRYILFLNEFKKCTPPDHPDYSLISEALGKLSEVTSAMNENKRETESLSRLVTLCSMIQFDEEENKVQRKNKKKTFFGNECFDEKLMFVFSSRLLFLNGF